MSGDSGVTFQARSGPKKDSGGLPTILSGLELGLTCFLRGADRFLKE